MPDPLRRPRVLALLAALLATTPAAAQDPAERQAEQMLGAARKAYNDGNARFAADTFAEYLKKHSGQKGGHAARLGLGLALLDLPERDYKKAAETLGPPANEAAFADRPLALYYLGVCQRGLGLKAAREAAHGPFAEAARSFGLAREAFDRRAADGDAEWAARARCDLADVELRLNRPKEARAAVEPFVADAALAAGKSRPLGLYYHGFACFLLNDIPAAGKSLGLVATLDQPFAPHARYLLGRVHQAEGENAEAAAAFDAVIAGYEKQKKAAVEALQHPDRFKNDPWEKARLEALRTEPPPEYVVGATFHGACLNYEAGRFGEALPKFQAFAKDFAASPLAPDALLRAGFCLVQLKQYDEAAKLLRPLADQHKRLADQALYWLGKAQLGQAQAADPGRRKAADANGRRHAAVRRRPGRRPRGPGSRGQGAAHGHRRRDGRRPDGRRPVPRGRRRLPARLGREPAAGPHRGGARSASSPPTNWPATTRPPSRKAHSSNNGFRAARSCRRCCSARRRRCTTGPAAWRRPRTPRARTRSPRRRRGTRSWSPSTRSSSASTAARYALALCHAEADDWEKAAAVLETIPAADRTGEAAAAVLLLADALIRTAPAKADDALQDNMLREKLGNAIALLEGFAAANAKAPEAAEALLKLGYCYKRLGIQLADPKEKNEAFNKARAALDRVRKEFPAAAAAGPATLERAKLRILQGDRNGAVEELRPFTQDPLRQSSAAPLALVTLATLLRERNQAATAVALLKDAQTRYDAVLAQDPRRPEWVKLLRYHYGVALLDAGQPVEARQVLEPLAGTNVGSQIGAEAALKSEAALAADMRRRWDELERERNKPGRTAAQLDDVTRRGKGLTREYVEHVRHMVRRADSLPAAPAAAEARARMYYEAAWLFRSLAPFAPLNPQARPQTDADRAAKDGLPQELLDGAGAYAKLVAAFPDAALAVDARFELAELEADAGRADEAVRLLKEALDKEPADRPTPPEAAERMRLRLGAALFDRKDYDAARGQFDAVAANAKSPLRGQALYRAAECLFAQGKAEEAKAALKPFRDDPAFQKLDGLTDRALLRLGHAYAAVKNWESSRVVLEMLLNRFGHGPWAADARYGVGVALQGLNRLDEAVGQFAQVTALKADELAGRAHLQIGLCRLAQKKYGEAVKAFQTVSYGYDAPDLRFAAMLEEARALSEDKKPAEAAKLLEKVVRDVPDGSEWFKAAKERLGKK